MDQAPFAALSQSFDMVHGVTLLVIAAFGDEGLDFTPIATVRTARERGFHIYGQERMLAEAARQGRFEADAGV